MNIARLLLFPALLATSAAVAAPLDFELAAQDGFVRLSTLPPQTTVVNFWRSDCPPCVAEMPLLAKLAQGGKVRVIAVAVQRLAQTLDAPPAVQAALKPPILSLHAPSDPRGLLARFGDPKQALPHTVMLDSAREVCAARTGQIDRTWLDAALANCAR